eukprot:scaffold8363_cov39-Cyclotella_meneghiniana.AAC.2
MANLCAIHPRQATSRSDKCVNSDVSVADQNNLLYRPRNPFIDVPWVWDLTVALMSASNVLVK